MRVLGKAVKDKIKGEDGAGVDRPLLPGEWLIEKEAEAEAIFVASCRREGCVFYLNKSSVYLLYSLNPRSFHQAYLPIVAASTRASTLHYCCNDREFAWGPVKAHDHQNKNDLAHGKAKELNPQVLLIDAGCEWECYASDITRTMPVGNGGKFTPEARTIYELVLEMQKVRTFTLALSRFLVNVQIRNLFLAILRHHQGWSPLGRRSAHLPPYAGQRVPETWHLQVPRFTWLGFVEL